MFPESLKKLGYPSRGTLKLWLQEYVDDYPRKKDVHIYSPLVHSDKKKKEQAVKDICLRDRNVREIADKYGGSSYSIYNWAWQKFGKGNLPVKKRAFKLEDKSLEELKKDNERLKRENVELERHNHYLHMENDALQIASKLLKKNRASV